MKTTDEALLPDAPPAWRALAAAAVVSAALHGAAFVAWHPLGAPDIVLDAPAYVAQLEAASPPPSEPAQATAAARPRPTARPKPRTEPSPPRPEETVAMLPEPESPAPEAEPPSSAQASPPAEPAESPPSAPETVALAMPPAPAPTSEPPAFRPDALPEEITIRYALTSAFADGVSEFNWKREGDRYEISGSAQAVGFFTVFLEGRIDQSASGRITPEGLQPERFTERRGNTPEEGLSFDWRSRTVEFRRGDSTRSAPLTDNTVDWLSMIFQLAHRPPAGDTLSLRVFTQRRLYEYRLAVAGTETIEIPAGRVRALHLRHEGEKPEEAVDVWLGIDQHYLPVKLRYPIARNRLVVEQAATAIKAR